MALRNRPTHPLESECLMLEKCNNQYVNAFGVTADGLAMTDAERAILKARLHLLTLLRKQIFDDQQAD